MPVAVPSTALVEIHLDPEMPSQVRRMDIGDPSAFKLIASGTAMSLMGESSKSHLKVFSGFVLLMSLSCQRQATAKADICRCRSFGGNNIRTLT